MRTKILSISFFVLLAACSLPLENMDPKAEQSGFDAPQSIFDGKWVLLEIKGFDFQGHAFVRDSVSESYSLRFEFHDSNGEGGKITPYRNLEKELDYIYQFTASAEQTARRMSIDKVMNSLPDEYYWEIMCVGEETHLFLRNMDYFKDECCPEKIEYHFLLVARNHS